MFSHPTGTVTFLFTDIEGSTPLAQKYPAALPALLARHHAILEQSFQAHNGYVFQIIGDAFSVAFHTAADALDAALDAQRALVQEKWTPAPIRVRMGIHTGAAQAERLDIIAGGYAGYSTLARAQRVMSAAHGGQILLSNASAELLRGELTAGVTLRDMHEHRLKGLLNPEHLWQVTSTDLPQDFPPLQPLNTIPNNLPVQLTSFIGRAQEIAEVKRLLATTRMLTLTGMGGAGKTRLALQIAAEVLDEYSDGVWLIELAPISDPALVPQQIASVLGLRDESGRLLIVALGDYFGGKKTLLVLDNCEHLIDSAARTAEALLRACPNVKIVATSREALGIAGELAWSVPPLTLPDLQHLPPVEQLTEFEATRLFVERARLVHPTFVLTDQNAPYVAQICGRLDGIPLAIELAAARMKGLSVEEIANHLDDRFRLLTGGSRTAVPRQQTLRSAIDWSYQLLDVHERTLVCRLAVFVGGWTERDARGICADDRMEAENTLDVMLRLVDKSFVIADHENGETRYRFLETVRQYALEKLLESGETQVIRERHADWFRALAEEVNGPAQGRAAGDGFKRLDEQHDNLRAGLQWAIENHQTENALRWGEVLWVYWDHQGYYREGLEWMKQILELPQPHDPALDERRANVLIGASVLYGRPDEHAQARVFAQQALTLAQQVGNRVLAARAWRLVGTEDLKLGHVSAAIRECEEGLALARESGDAIETAQCLHALGTANTLITNLQQARSHYKEALDLFRRNEKSVAVADALSSLGEVDYLEGNYGTAREHLEASLELARSQGNRHSMQVALRWLAHVARAQGDYARAEDAAQAELEWVRERGDRLCTAYLVYILGWTAFSRGESERGEALLTEALGLCEQVGSPPRVQLIRMRLGQVLLARGDIAGAELLFKSSLNWSRANGVRGLVVENMEGFALIARARGETERAEQLLTEAGAARASLHLPIAPTDRE